ncbi:MAG: adenylate/guanylate cyclase domain-containing protein [Synechococcaceae cyanobacterium SM2_3_1]|nr:adenylate/guanylate cyclase domain-containing protein [Synechococcaceae cyanobacterium SM2_3_1]
MGFNDVVVDSGGVVRRHLLFLNTPSAAYISFGMQLALNYLEHQGIVPLTVPDHPEHMQLGKARFKPLESDFGAYVGVDAGGYQILLDYRSHHGAAQRVTLSQVLAGEVDPAWIRGRIVLVGTIAESLHDDFYTPWSLSFEDQQKMAGVELQAQMVSQILSVVEGEHSLFWSWPFWGESIWLLIWSLGGGLLSAGVRGWQLHLLGTGLGLLSLGGISWGLFLLQGWIPVMAPMLGFVLTNAVVLVYGHQQAQQQQQMVFRLLGQNVSPEIAMTLWEQREQLLVRGNLMGQRLQATVLFADLRHFSALAETLAPETLLDWLNDYLACMTRTVQEHGGIVNKFMGDGLMAVFGVPVKQKSGTHTASDAEQAVSCALTMAQQLDQLNVAWHQQHLPTTAMRIGICTGPVFAGSLGSQSRLEYGVIGDCVNSAARLESYAKDRQDSSCRILIADSTRMQLCGHYSLIDWGHLELPGKQVRLRAYQVLHRS